MSVKYIKRLHTMATKKAAREILTTEKAIEVFNAVEKMKPSQIKGYAASLQLHSEQCDSCKKETPTVETVTEKSCLICGDIKSLK